MNTKCSVQYRMSPLLWITLSNVFLWVLPTNGSSVQPSHKLITKCRSRHLLRAEDCYLANNRRFIEKCGLFLIFFSSNNCPSLRVLDVYMYVKTALSCKRNPLWTPAALTFFVFVNPFGPNQNAKISIDVAANCSMPGWCPCVLNVKGKNCQVQHVTSTQKMVSGRNGIRRGRWISWRRCLMRETPNFPKSKTQHMFFFFFISVLHSTHAT